VASARAKAAEHWAFCDAPDSVQEIAAALIVIPIWAFWWD